MRKFCKESSCLYFANNSFVKHFTHNGNAVICHLGESKRHRANKVFLVVPSHTYRTIVVKVNSQDETFELIYAFTSVCFVSFPIRGTIDVRRKGTLNNRRYCFANARLIKRKAGNHVPRSFHRRRHVQVSFRLFREHELTFAILCTSDIYSNMEILVETLKRHP